MSAVWLALAVTLAVVSGYCGYAILVGWRRGR
jgi:hypothetical protein